MLKYFVVFGYVFLAQAHSLMHPESTGWGVKVQAMTPEMFESIGLNEKNLTGVIVTEIEQYSSAESVLKQGDIITHLNGLAIAKPENFDTDLKNLKFNQPVIFTIRRSKGADGELLKPHDVQFIPGTQPNNNTKNVQNGLFVDVEFEEKSEGVVVKNSKSHLFQKEDIIIELNGAKIKNIKDVENALSHNTNSISFSLKRGNAYITQSFSSGNGGNSISQSIIIH